VTSSLPRTLSNGLMRTGRLNSKANAARVRLSRLPDPRLLDCRASLRHARLSDWLSRTRVVTAEHHGEGSAVPEQFCKPQVPGPIPGAAPLSHTARHGRRRTRRYSGRPTPCVGGALAPQPPWPCPAWHDHRRALRPSHQQQPAEPAPSAHPRRVCAQLRPVRIRGAPYSLSLGLSTVRSVCSPTASARGR
jgi:hypothetical protein